MHAYLPHRLTTAEERGPAFLPLPIALLDPATYCFCPRGYHQNVAQNLGERVFARMLALRFCVRRSLDGLRALSSFPPHEIVTMPALSPTMEQGNMGSWQIEEGAEFSAGDVLAEVETDKATVDFEAVDDGFLAKILVPSGTADVMVGTPIAVSVEEAGDVSAFASFTAADAGGVEAAAPAPEPVVSPPPLPPPAPVAPSTQTPAVSAVPSVVAAPAAVPEVAPLAAAAVPEPMVPLAEPASPSLAGASPVSKPLSLKLQKEQGEFEAMYGSTLMRAVVG